MNPIYLSQPLRGAYPVVVLAAASIAWGLSAAGVTYPIHHPLANRTAHRDPVCASPFGASETECDAGEDAHEVSPYFTQNDGFVKSRG